MEGIFPQSKELNEIIQAVGWILYDITEYSDDRIDLEEVQRVCPAEEFEIGHNYFFSRKQRANQTLEAKSFINGILKPFLYITDPFDNGLPLFRVLTNNPNVIIASFDRIFFESRYAITISPTISSVTNIGVNPRALTKGRGGLITYGSLESESKSHRDVVVIEYEKLCEIFEKCFGSCMSLNFDTIDLGSRVGNEMEN